MTYDFETILSKIEDKRTDTLSFTNKHLPVSFSLFSNIPGYDKDPIFVCHNDVKELIDIFVKTLVDISVKEYEINVKKYSGVLDYLDRQIDIAIHEKDKSVLILRPRGSDSTQGVRESPYSNHQCA